MHLETPSVTTRGMKEKEMKEIAGFIYGALDPVRDLFRAEVGDKKRSATVCVPPRSSHSTSLTGLTENKPSATLRKV